MDKPVFNPAELGVLLVDDTPSNLSILRETLAPEGYKLAFATSGEKTLEIVSHMTPDLILLDVMMPGIDGFETCRRLKSDPALEPIPVIFITAKKDTEDIVEGLRLGGVDYISKPFRQEEVCARVRTHLELRQLRKVLEVQNRMIRDQNVILEEKVRERTRELRDTRLEIVNRLGRAAEYRDNETGMHVIRMSRYSAALGRAVGLSDAECDLLLNASPMHDIGKIGIPDAILLKPGRLTGDEWKLMKTHTVIGAKILAGSNFKLMEMAETIALTHQERWDGSGYPRGLKGKEIPLEGRIVALADVFDALTTERPYKKAWPVEDAMKEIGNKSGVDFDPELAEVFKKILPEILQIRKQLLEPGP